MFKKYCKSIAVILFFFLIFTGKAVYAEENYKIWNDGNTSIVDSDKIWTISFNKAFDIDTAKNYIKVYETDNNQSIDVDFSKGTGNTLEIRPKNAYNTGKNYEIVIDGNFTDAYGDKLAQPVKYDFSIDDKDDSGNNQVQVNSYTEYYNAVKEALSNYDPQLVIYIKNYSYEAYKLDVINSIIKDSPDMGEWYESARSTISSDSDGNSDYSKMTIDFSYSDTKENLVKKDNEVQQKVNAVVNKVTNSSMTDYEKELALHDYVVNNTQYDSRADTDLENMPYDSYTSYGILINGVGVCQGYANAMYRLLKAAGIENMVVIGQANNGDGSGWIGHAWNIVKIQGNYYNLDTTWDDPVDSDGSNVLSHRYFNVTDTFFSKNHSWEQSQYPKCTSTDYSYENIEKMGKYKYAVAVN